MVRSARAALLLFMASVACAATALLPRLAASDVAAAARADAAAPAPSEPEVALVREGSPVALSRRGERLYVASEELHAVRAVDLSYGEGHTARMPGAAANLVVLPDDRVLLTVRDPGLLLVLRPDPAAGLVETARVELPADAWGLAVSPDASTAYVTSAWTHAVTAVDLAAHAVRWKLDVAREPRGIVAHPRGPVYVSHLTSGLLTRIDGADGAAPTARAVSLPLAPLRTPRRGAVEGSLGYTLALSPDGLRLYAPRHALGVVGDPAWFGAATVDVMLVPDDTPLAPARARTLFEVHEAGTDDASAFPSDPSIDPARGPIPMTTPVPFSQPRAVVYRRTSHTLLVAGEGDKHLTELDALAPDPALAVVRKLPMGSDQWNDPYGGCVAPSGIALSADEQTAFVYCRASFVVTALPLDGSTGSHDYAVGRDPLDPNAAAGRKLFYTGRRRALGEGLACSGCHPEGRDDGHVWHEIDTDRVPPPRLVQARIFTGGFGTVEIGGAPRQTPMLAGRVGSPGPYGWLGEDATLHDRIEHGAKLHRWSPQMFVHGYEKRDFEVAVARIEKFLRTGLVPPPRPARPPTELEARGKAIFERADVGCASCHLADDTVPAIVTKLPMLPTREGFDDEDVPLKVPSLRFVGGTPPYLHDGSEPTLSQLLEHNRDRMGHTAQLTADERAALAAYLETL